MHTQLNQISWLKTSFLYGVIVLQIIVVRACGLVERKTETSPVSQEKADISPSSKTSGTDKNKNDKKDVTKGETQSSVESESNPEKTAGVEVIEPKNISQPELQVEPIKPPAPEQKEETAVATEKSVAGGKTPDTESKEPVNIAKIEPAVPKSQVPQTPVTGKANTFVITVEKKDRRHPKFGEGHEMGFLINGVPGGTIVLERGKSYTFDVETNPKHDVYISKKPIGWGASPWSEGVEGAYIYQGIITFTPGKDAPDVLYYSCRNHPYMGGEIRIVNPGEKIDIAKLNQSSGVASAQPQNASKPSKPQISVAMVNQKLMFAGMLITSSNSTRVKSSSNEDAKQMQAKAEKLVESAKQKLKANKNQEAYSDAEEALKLLKAAADLVPNEEQVAAAKERHQELLTSVHNFELSHKENYERIQKAGGKAAAVDYDKKQVARIKEEARVLAEKGDYVNAIKKLETAQHIITTAIQQMLNSQTIVYDLNFATPKDEYEYELKRYGGYEELIPIAVEQKRPNEGMKKLMETYVKKGQGMRDTAVATAKAGDYPRAIAMMQDATEEIRRALRMLGVSQ